MSSPFPGMDPYWKGSLWTTLHFTLAVLYDFKKRDVSERQTMATPADMWADWAI